eukprot:748459-Prorocentrum_minimum.AAC.2
MQCAPTQATRAPLRSTIERPRVQTRARVVRHRTLTLLLLTKSSHPLPTLAQASTWFEHVGWGLSAAIGCELSPPQSQMPRWRMACLPVVIPSWEAATDSATTPRNTDGGPLHAGNDGQRLVSEYVYTTRDLAVDVVSPLVAYKVVTLALRQENPVSTPNGKRRLLPSFAVCIRCLSNARSLMRTRSWDTDDESCPLRP